MEEISTENSIKKNKDINSSKKIFSQKQTFRIYGFILVILLSLVFILLALFLFCKGIYDIFNSYFEINNFIGSIIIFIIAGIITYYFPFFSSITVDIPKKLVIIKKYRFLFLKNKTLKIDADKIIQAYTEKNKDEGYGTNENNSYDGLDLIFILNDGNRIVGLEGEIDKNNDRRKLDIFLRQFFPGDSNSDNKNSVYIQMQSFTSQYQPINNNNFSSNIEQNLITNEQSSQNKKNYNIFLGINDEN